MIGLIHFIVFKIFFFLFFQTGSQNPVSESIYQETNKNVEKLSKKMYTILMLVIASLYVIPANLMAIYEYIASDYSTETFKQMMPAV